VVAVTSTSVAGFGRLSLSRRSRRSNRSSRARHWSRSGHRVAGEILADFVLKHYVKHRKGDYGGRS
jgi:hypothetical protein